MEKKITSVMSVFTPRSVLYSAILEKCRMFAIYSLKS